MLQGKGRGLLHGKGEELVTGKRGGDCYREIGRGLTQEGGGGSAPEGVCSRRRKGGACGLVKLSLSHEDYCSLTCLCAVSGVCTCQLFDTIVPEGSQETCGV